MPYGYCALRLLGRLAAVSGGAGNLARYRYNALGQRVAKDAASGNVRFAYDEAGHLVGEYDSTGKTIQVIVWLGDLPVASLRPKLTGGTEVFHIHPDHLGTPRQITDSLNKMVWRWDTAEPFGAELPNEDPDGDGVRFEFNLRFPGQYYDKETRRHYNYFRDCYDPKSGRYCQPDPIGLAGGLNRYSYVGGNPVSRTDPTGLGYLDLAKCLVGFPDVAQAKNQCKKECPANGKPEELIKWVDQYGGGSVAIAERNCTCQKLGPGRCKEWINTCFEGASYPTSPIKPKVKF